MGFDGHFVSGPVRELRKTASRGDDDRVTIVAGGISTAFGRNSAAVRVHLLRGVSE